MATILIALGANLGDRGETLSEAIDQLAADPDFTLVGRSQLLVTRPIGGPSGQPDFLNAAARFTTLLTPAEVHQKLIEVEQLHGRIRVQRWGARSLDLDLILYDDQVIRTPLLSVPHPRMSFRRFVMQPAAEVAADLIHPELGSTIGQLWQQLSTAPPVAELATLPGPTAWRFCHEVQKKLADLSLFVPTPPENWPAAVSDLPARMRQMLPQHSQLAHPPARFDVCLIPWWSKLGGSIPDTFSFPGNCPPLAEAGSEAPRLVVFWIPPVEFSDPVERTWWPGDDRDTLADRLAEVVRREVHGPRLWLETGDWTAAVTEVAAAIEAIRG